MNTATIRAHEYFRLLDHFIHFIFVKWSCCL